jgi:hypothetical protein
VAALVAGQDAAKGQKMYLVLAYGFLVFTVLLFALLLWLAWQNKREEDRRGG